MIRLLIIKVNPCTLTGRLRIGSFGSQKRKEQEYIPLRALKEDHNVLFSIEGYRPVSWMARCLAFLPMTVVALDIVMSELTWWRALGFFCLYYIGRLIMKIVTYRRTHEVFQLRCNKSMQKYTFQIINNRYGRIIEAELFEMMGTTHEYKYKERLLAGIKRNEREGRMDLSAYKDVKDYDSATWSKMADASTMSRPIIDLEFQVGYIQRMELMTAKQLKKLLWQRSKRRGLFFLEQGKDIVQILEPYNTSKEEKNCLVFVTKKIGQMGQLLFYLRLDDNKDKKYEQYLKALGEGKKIVQI